MIEEISDLSSKLLSSPEQNNTAADGLRGNIGAQLTVERLRTLKRLGEELGANIPTIESDPESIRVEAWLGAVHDFLSEILPENSSLLKQMYAVQESARQRDGNTKPKQPTNATLIQSALDLLSYIDQSTIRMKYSSEPTSFEGRFVAQLERDFNAVYSERVAKSWFFRIPVLLLLGAFIFAVAGVIKIRDYEIDIQKLSETATQRMEFKVEQQGRDASSNLKAQEMNAQRVISETLQEAVATGQARFVAITEDQGRILNDDFGTSRRAMSQTVENTLQRVVTQSLDAQDQITSTLSNQLAVLNDQAKTSQIIISNTTQAADLPARIEMLEQRLGPEFQVATLRLDRTV